MRQLVSRLRGDRTARAAGRKGSPRADANPRMDTSRSRLTTFLQRACAVLLAVVCYAFFASVPHPPSVALGIAYAVSGLCLAIAAWRLWWPTMQ